MRRWSRRKFRRHILETVSRDILSKVSMNNNEGTNLSDWSTSFARMTPFPIPNAWLSSVDMYSCVADLNDSCRAPQSAMMSTFFFW